MLDKLRPYIYPFSIFLVFIVYGSILNAGRIWDGEYLMKSSFPEETNFLRLIILYFKSSNWPIFKLYHEFIYRIFSDSNAAYHFFSLSFHVLNSLLLFNFLKKIKFKYKELVCSVFLLHPIQVFTVAWIFQFKTILSLFFILISSLFIYKFYIDKFIKNYVLALIFCFLSFKTKSSFILVPFIWMSYLYLFKKEWKEYIKYFIPFVLLIFYSAYSIVFIGGTPVAMKQMEQISGQKGLYSWSDPLSRLSLIGICLDHYVFSFFNFSNLRPLYGRYLEPVWVILLRLCLYILGVTYVLIKGSDKVRFLTLSLIFLILPFIGIVMAPYMGVTPFADQHQYLSLIIIYILFIFGLEKVYKSRRFIYTFSTILLCIFSFSTFQFQKSFQRDLSFYNHSISIQPASIAAYVSFASKLSIMGHYSKAKKVLTQALEKENNFTVSEIEYLKRKMEKINALIEVLEKVKKGPSKKGPVNL